jgi:hypothetical protein
MTSTAKMTSFAVGVLLSSGVSIVAWADAPSDYVVREGTVLSTHTPETGVCRITRWDLTIGPGETVRGTIKEDGTSKAWQMMGTYDSHGTFHLRGQEVGGAERARAIDAQMELDGSMIFRMTDIGDPSSCYNRTVYLPWFRNGNDFGPASIGGGGG